MEIEIPRTFQALNLFSDSNDIARQLDGKTALVSIVYPKGSKLIFHPDGVYEIAKLNANDNGSQYIAEISGDDGEAKRIEFSLENLAGILVSSSNGNILKLEEHPGRFRKVKIRGNCSHSPREVLESQVGKLVLLDSNDNPRLNGRYHLTKIEEAVEDFYRATMITSNGASTGLYHYEDVRGIFVAEKNLPSEFVRRSYH